MVSTKPLVHDLSYLELEKQLKLLGEPGYRARQIWVALYQHFIDDAHQMTTLPKVLREKLADYFSFNALSPVRSIQSRDGQTTKTLFKLSDNLLIETVLMIYENRRTLCISSQSGCGLGCKFCATGQMGFLRNLTSGEIVAQVTYFGKKLAEKNDRLTNVVLMGMGEPFLNYDHVMAAIERLNDPDAFGLGARRMTISTVGVVPKIKQFAETGTQVNLAISLHTVNNDLRSELIPINKKYPVESILEACRYYIAKTNRRVTFEYALIDGVNDSVEEATALAQKLKGMLCHVNLIPLNPTRGYNKQGAGIDQVESFRKVLDEFHIPCTVRLRRGIEISAGCGQLAVESTLSN